MNKDENNDHNYESINTKEQLENKQRFQIVQDGNAVKKEIEPNTIPVFLRPEPKRKVKRRRILPFLLTIISAGVISILLGVAILQMFIMVEDQPIGESNIPEGTATITSSQPIEQSIPELSGYILQAGVFTEKENAEEWLVFYESENIPAIIWESDNQYFLFTNIYAAEEEAKLKVLELKEDEFDIFAKPWSTSTGELKLSVEELEWLHTFQETWVTSLVNKEGEQLAELADSAPNSNQLSMLIERLEVGYTENDVQFFLELMHLYEQIGKDI